jgi:hypothetical protein
MPLEVAPPPKVPLHFQGRVRYNEFMDALVAGPGTWVSLPLDEVAGADHKTKGSAIHTAAKNRGFKVQTTIQGGRIYARRLI